MNTFGIRWAKPIAAIAACAVLASCGLPQVGPNKRQIYAGSVQREGDAFIVAVNDRVTRATAVVQRLASRMRSKTRASLARIRSARATCWALPSMKTSTTACWA